MTRFTTKKSFKYIIKDLFFSKIKGRYNNWIFYDSILGKMSFNLEFQSSSMLYFKLFSLRLGTSFKKMKIILRGINNNLLKSWH